MSLLLGVLKKVAPSGEAFRYGADPGCEIEPSPAFVHGATGQLDNRIQRGGDKSRKASWPPSGPRRADRADCAGLKGVESSTARTIRTP